MTALQTALLLVLCALQATAQFPEAEKCNVCVNDFGCTESGATCYKPDANKNGCCVTGENWRQHFMTWWNANVAQQPQVYQPVTTTRQPDESVDECQSPCKMTSDCAAGLSCFGASSSTTGCCLKSWQSLKPDQTGCLINEQCTRACETSYCAKESSPFTRNKSGKCKCEQGSHFLFNKCWHQCPSFADPVPVKRDDGTTVCRVRTSMNVAMAMMRRMKRQAPLTAPTSSGRIFC